MGRLPEFLVEGWTPELVCAGFYRRSLVKAVRSAAAHLYLDLGCDRVYVRSEAGELVASWTPGRGWFDIRLPYLEALEAEVLG